MNSRDFVYWLQGFFEISESNTLTSTQVDVIKNHLNMVFAHEIDPSHGDEKHQAVLNELHTPSKFGPGGLHPKSHLNMTQEEWEKAGRPRC